jgi:hypothetical protein
LPVESGGYNFSETSIDKNAKSFKNIEEAVPKYRENFEDEHQREADNYYKSSYEYDG